ncbi:MAG TPA: hypothetical protein ENI07_14285 [Desulfobacterales bacterium]|nr:hypothetical protein [Desulfobacterales bacterium]
MALQKVTIEDELIHDIDQMIKALKLRRAAILARMPVVVRRRVRTKNTVFNGRVWDFDSYTKRKEKGA